MAGVASIADENWTVLVSAFPSGWREAGKTTGAIKHDLKDFRSEDDLIRVLLLHAGKGLSLRETAVVAKLAGLANVSDVAILKRLRKSEPWLHHLCKGLLHESGIDIPKNKAGLKLRAVDGSIIKEPGKTGSQWRLHYSIRLPELTCDAFEITPTDGEGNGESFVRYPLQAGDYILGDRGYSTSRGIEYIHNHQAFVLVRVNSSALPLFTANGKSFKLLKSVSTIQEALAVKEWPVFVQGKAGDLISGRLCALRKSDVKIEEAQKKLRAQAIKKQKELRPETLEFAKYVMVFSTFPDNQFSSQELLEWYRIRWQIELIFKRLKTLLKMGHLPKFDPRSARAWLYGKLFVALLTEKLARISRAFSPWGYSLSEPVA